MTGTSADTPSWSDEVSDDEFTDVSAPETPSAFGTAFDIQNKIRTVLDKAVDSEEIAPANLVMETVTRAYLSTLDPENCPPPRVVEQQLLGHMNAEVFKQNMKIRDLSKDDQREQKLSRYRVLNAWQVAQILLVLHHIVRIAPISQNTDREYDVLAMYRSTGPRRGTYTTSEDDIRTAARLYNTTLNLNDFKELQAILREDSPRVHKVSHRDLLPANNGIVYYGDTPIDLTIGGKQFHFEPKTVHPFDPAIVLVTKPSVDYVIDAPPIVITHPETGEEWEIRQWIQDLSDDEGIPDLLWEILSAIMRPYVRWKKTAWLFSERGNNGKGTFCELARNLIGDGAHTSIPLSDFSKNFALEPLMSSNAIIVDENPVGTFIDDAANLKAVVTGDVIQIDRKYRMPVAFQFQGFMVQCLNGFPRAKDKSDSFYRRQLFVPFNKWFGSNEKEYIKEDYLKRREVLEYAFWYAVNQAGVSSPGSFYKLSEPAATRAVLEEYKETNDPVRGFWEELRERFVWDLLPVDFLFELYKAWIKENSPSGSMMSKQSFAQDLRQIVRDDPLWAPADKNTKVRPGKAMIIPEPLIEEFVLTKFYAPGTTGKEPMKQFCRPLPSINYRAPILRRGSSVFTDQGELPDEDTDTSITTDDTTADLS